MSAPQSNFYNSLNNDDMGINPYAGNNNRVLGML